MILVGVAVVAVITTVMITKRKKASEIKSATNDAAQRVFDAIQTGTLFDATPIETGYWNTHGCTGQIINPQTGEPYGSIAAANADPKSYCDGDITQKS